MNFIVPIAIVAASPGLGRECELFLIFICGTGSAQTWGKPARIRPVHLVTVYLCSVACTRILSHGPTPSSGDLHSLLRHYDVLCLAQGTR